MNFTFWSSSCASGSVWLISSTSAPGCVMAIQSAYAAASQDTPNCRAFRITTRRRVSHTFARRTCHGHGANRVPPPSRIQT